MIWIMILKLLTLLLLYEINCERNYDPRIVLKKMSTTIGEHVLTCQEQMGFKQDVISTFLKYWSANTALDNPTVGCVVMCVLGELQLLAPQWHLKKENAAAFFTAKGSDQFTTEILLELYDLCKEITKFSEECNYGINLAKCFRGGILMRGWNPDSLDPDANDENYDYAA